MPVSFDLTKCRFDLIWMLEGTCTWEEGYVVAWLAGDGMLGAEVAVVGPRVEVRPRIWIILVPFRQVVF